MPTLAYRPGQVLDGKVGVHQVIEPLGVRRATGAIFALFAVVGIGVTVAMLIGGEGIFGVLFGTMFVGIPALIHRLSRGPGVPGFMLTSDGILGAADDEQRLIPWSEVEGLAWRGTGLTVNNVPCVALHAVLTDGHSLRITSLPARRGREVEDVIAQVEASGLLPERLRIEVREGRISPSARFASGTTDATPPPAGGTPTVTQWSDLPRGARVAIIVFGVLFGLPFVFPLLVLPFFLLAAIGPLGWIVAAAVVASGTFGLRRLVERRLRPVLACSFTVEGVVAELGEGLTIPWEDGARLRVDPTFAQVEPGTSPSSARGWVVRLQRPEAGTVELSPVLTSQWQVTRAVSELATARELGYIPRHVELTLPLDLDPAFVDRLRERWQPDHD